MSTDASPPREPSLRASLLQHVGAAVAVVALVTALFGVIGAVGTPDEDPVATGADTPEPEAPDFDTAPPDPPESEDDEATPDPDDTTADENTDAEGDGTEDEDAADASDDGDDNGDDPEDSNGGEDDADTDEDGDDQPSVIDPATISVQVLDGYQADGGAAANRVAEQLREAGYDLIAQNPALRYDVTTVLWTAGHEAEARQVAAEIGAPEARQQSGNLSSSVAVHVVVGSDRG